VSTLTIRTSSLTATLLAVVLVFASVGPAFADKLTDKQAQATKVEAQVAELEKKAEIATEDYNAARERYRLLTVKVNAIEDQMANVQARQDKLQTALNARANSIYRDGGPLRVVEMLLSTRSIEDFNSTLELLTRVSQQDADTTAQLKQTTRELTAVHTALADAQAAAKHQQLVVGQKEKAVKTELAARQKVLDTIKADIRVIIAQRAAAAEAAARARYMSYLGSGGLDLGGNPPTSSKGAAAVWWAEKALGAPYEWAAAGPRTFDCSGLVMWAYAHVGVKLPHYSRAQINVGARVARDHLQPGDLVFFGSPIHHVGMYVGGGTFIEAPYTGARVRFSSLASRGDYAGACRP
jgi:peptidoglycan DL-endopeptidase CwlO